MLGRRERRRAMSTPRERSRAEASALGRWSSQRSRVSSDLIAEATLLQTRPGSHRRERGVKADGIATGRPGGGRRASSSCLSVLSFFSLHLRTAGLLMSSILHALLAGVGVKRLLTLVASHLLLWSPVGGESVRGGQRTRRETKGGRRPNLAQSWVDRCRLMRGMMGTTTSTWPEFCSLP